MVQQTQGGFLPPQWVLPAVIAALLLGLLAGYLFGRLIGRKRNSQNSSTIPMPPQPQSAGAAVASRAYETSALVDQIDHVRRVKDALEDDSDELWRFHKTPVPTEILDRIHRGPLKVVTFVNLKGGVGKTTTTANLAAVFANRGKRVLVVDFDYQGSLTAMLMRAGGQLEVDSSLADSIVDGTGEPSVLTKDAKSLHGVLPQVNLITAAYSLSRLENRMLIRWLLDMEDGDIRYNLAHLLSDEQVLNSYDLVLIDTPPRMNLATINALAASTHFVVPTILDGLSIENVGGLLQQAKAWFKDELNPQLEFAGVIANMTAPASQSATQNIVRSTVKEQATAMWGPTAHIFEQHIPNRSAFVQAAGNNLAVLTDKGENSAATFFDALADELSDRIGLV